jgi:structural maintenance of chromosome 3 (chondroitin sulfate proteoglycan 6)
LNFLTLNLAAIEFVLSEKFAGIRGDSRSKLLHEGAGKSVMSAYVELIFDNSDGRFPVRHSFIRSLSLRDHIM